AERAVGPAGRARDPRHAGAARHAHGHAAAGRGRHAGAAPEEERRCARLAPPGARPRQPRARLQPVAGRHRDDALGPARRLARVLESVEADAAVADLALDAELARRALPPRDIALATELIYGTLRWQRYLDWILSPHSRRRLPSLDARVRVLLRLTAYQLAFLERVPAFAAVNDAVTLARGAPGVAEYVNAVLRAFARRGAPEREPAPPREALEALATRCSFPSWLAARWLARYGAEEAEALMRALNERPPLTLRANTRRTGRDALAERLRAEEQVQT